MDKPRLEKLKAKLEAGRNRRSILFQKAAKSISPKFKGMDIAALECALEEIWEEFQGRLVETEDIKDGAKAKEDLQILADRADELAKTMLDLDQGAVEAMVFGDFDRDLYNFAKPYKLPARNIPLELVIGSAEEVNRQSMEEAAGGLWVIRLRSLAKLARQSSDCIGELIAKGGRISLATRLHGSSEEWLARACKKFAEDHGAKTQSVVITMVNAIMKASGIGLKYTDPGRRVVRNLAKTTP